MAYTNSPLVTYTRISNNKTSPRNHEIDTITIHCIVGQWTAKQGCDYFATTDRQCSSNYIVGKDGSIGLSVEEKDRSWCTSSRDNDNRAITIETASDTTHPYAVTDAAYNALIELVADICKRNGKNKIIWFADKEKTLNYKPAPNEMLMTVHRWFANKSCPGEYLYTRHADIAEKVNKKINTTTETPKTEATIDVAKFKTNTPEQTVEMVGPIFTKDMEQTGILASVSMAQFILESGWGKGELAQNALNFFGMKATVSSNTWSGSTWKGEKYNIKTSEWDGEKYVDIYADFRKYNSVEESIGDHSAYLANAMKGTQKRYDGLTGEKDYKKAAEIIKAGGYATDPNYVTKLCNLIEKYNLNKYDAADTQTPSQETTTKPNTTLKVGDLVKITGTHYYNMSKEIPSWVKNQNWYIKSIYTEYAIVDKNEAGTNAINSPIKLTDLLLAAVSKPVEPQKPAEQPKPVEPTPTTPTVKIKVGDLVKITGNTYYSGKTIPGWVKNQNWYVKSVSGDRVVIDKNQKGTNSINSPVHIDNLALVNGNTTTQTTELKVGDVVKIKRGCKVYGQNKQFQSWVYDATLYVREIRKDSVVISTLKTGAITGVVAKEDIIR